MANLNFQGSMIALIIALMLAPLPNALAHPRSPSAEIENLLKQLDAATFEMREDATNQLIALGQSALQPVAMHFFEASPESAWRVKRILEQIGTEAKDEETSLKAIAILILLDHRLDGELAGLLATWRENRSTRAVEYLVSKGASTRPSGLHRQIVVQQPFAPFQDANSIKNDRSDSRSGEKREASSEAEIAEEIETIANGSFRDVQKFVFARLPAVGSGTQQIDNRILGPGLGAIRNGGWTFLEFGDQWKGSASDLLRLKEIHSLQGVRFDQQTLNRKDLAIISQLTNLSHFGISDTGFRGARISDLDLPDSVSSVELRKQMLDESTMKWLSSLSLENLVVDECRIRNPEELEFSRLSDLVLLDLRRINIDRTMFQDLEDLPVLRQIYLSVCKFDPAYYKEFAESLRKRKRQRRTAVVFNPVSFLGVQAMRNGLDRENWSCRIEMVVPDSGADKAGIKAGDIITAVNGSPITVFEELRMHISQHDIGEQMELDILRGSKPLKLTATLGPNQNMLPR